MDKTIYLTNLYDYYGELLTKKQQSYFEDYYFNNLSLSEIAENENVSRNAAYSQIKNAEEKLNYYEDILNLYNKSKEIKKIIKKLDKDTKQKIEELI